MDWTIGQQKEQVTPIWARKERTQVNSETDWFSIQKQ